MASVGWRPPPSVGNVVVADTTMFTDAKLREVLGARSLEEAARIMARILARASRMGLTVYITPSVRAEIERFMLGNGVHPTTFARLMAWVRVKPPTTHDLRLPAAMFRRYVETVRARLDKGLRVAEDHVRRALRSRDEEGDIVRSLREKYREYTRKGLLDSVEDVDTLLLALELGAAIVTSDEGLRRAAEDLGITVLTPVELLEYILALEEEVKSVEE
ncbi:RNA ligase partner protein [Aeropyrum pernix]|uniref:RNA ligase partner protein n=1 Tax=Aeropyrum pernix TaxID=56636 RepID=UPI001FB265CB|nr:RNA ligase partner protein [Aeropyrum pernix]